MTKFFSSLLLVFSIVSASAFAVEEPKILRDGKDIEYTNLPVAFTDFTYTPTAHPSETLKIAAELKALEPSELNQLRLKVKAARGGGEVSIRSGKCSALPASKPGKLRVTCSITFI